MEIEDLKRKLRDLKKVECRIRFDNKDIAGDKYVWSRFFSTKDSDVKAVRYPLHILMQMDKQRFREVVEEYFYSVYYQKYKESGLTPKDVYDPGLLSIFGLQPDADHESIKARFRELAKKYHPDHGGDSEKMIEILEVYHRLTDNR